MTQSNRKNSSTNSSGAIPQLWIDERRDLEPELGERITLDALTGPGVLVGRGG